MNRLLTALAFLFLATAASGQTAGTYLQNGLDKFDAGNYNTALTDYTKAIELDKHLKEAYYNRGMCEIVLKDFSKAINDFDTAIQLDVAYTEPYVGRAAVLEHLHQREKAIADLSTAIDIKPKQPLALEMRGELRIKAGDIAGCDDIWAARLMGDEACDALINKYCGGDRPGTEILVLDWPQSEHWKVRGELDDSEFHIVKRIHENEYASDNWTELTNMMYMKGVKESSVDTSMQLTYTSEKRHGPNAKLTVLEKDEKAAYPWILFLIENTSSNDSRQETQLWYIVQGQENLYSNSFVLRDANMSLALIEKWSRFFKTAKVVRQ